MSTDEACVLLADALRDLGDARTRIADLEGEHSIHQQMLRAALDLLARMTPRVEQQSRIIAGLRDRLRQEQVAA